MLKKILIAAMVVFGLVYGSGSDFASIKRSILGAASENARGMIGATADDWGAGSGY